MAKLPQLPAMLPVAPTSSADLRWADPKKPTSSTASTTLLTSLPATLVTLVFAHLPTHFKLRTCGRLNHSLAACLTPSAFSSDHVSLSPPLLRNILASSRLATQLSSIASVSVSSDNVVDKSLVALTSRPLLHSTAIPHPLSLQAGTASLFPNITFYSQRVDGIGFHPSSLSSFTHLQQLYVDTRLYDASIVLQLSAVYGSLHSVKLHALLSVAHLEAIYALPALTSLDLAGCTVLGGDIAIHTMPLVSLMQPPTAASAIGRLRALLCPLGEQRVADIVAVAKAQQHTASLEYLRCDDSPLTEQCIVDLLTLPSLTALEIQSHNIRWEQPPFATLASSTSPLPSPSLRRLRFVADHDLRDRPQTPQAIFDSMTSFLWRFRQLHVLDFTLPSSLPLTHILQQLMHLHALHRLTITRNKSGAGQRLTTTHDPFDLDGDLTVLGGGGQLAFPNLHTFVCRRVVDMDESALMLMLSQMPALEVLRVLESPLMGSGAVLACSAFCSQLRSMAVIACSKSMLADEHWLRCETLLERVTAALSMQRTERPPSTLMLPRLQYLSLQAFGGSVGMIAMQRLVELLVVSPLQYFGLIIRTVAGGNELSSTTGLASLKQLSLHLTALLEPLPLVGLAIPGPPLLRSASSPRVVDNEYSQQWMESEEAMGRRERSVMVADRLTSVVESDEQLLYEWMTRHRQSQQQQFAHVFKPLVQRTPSVLIGKQAYFDDVRAELEKRARSGIRSDNDDMWELGREEAVGRKRPESEERKAETRRGVFSSLLHYVCGSCCGR